jgi:hypothetical protein
MIYIFIFLILIILTLLLELNNSKKVVGDKNIYNILLVIFILVAGLRWKVGGDTLAYMNFFEHYAPIIGDISNYDFSAHKFEPLFVIFMSISKSILNEFWLFQMFHAIFINIVIFHFIKKYTPYKYTAVLLYFFFYYFYLNTEILRESIAICVFLLMFQTLRDKKYFSYYIGCIIAILFHSSAFLLLFFPLMAKLRFTYKTLVFLLIGGLLLTQFIANLSSLLALIPGQSTLASRFELYSGLKLNINGMILTFGIFVFLPFVLVSFNKRNNNRLEMFKELEFSYFIFAILFVYISGLGRLINYFSIFMIIYFTNSICFLLNSKRKFLIFDYRFATIIMFITAFSYKTSYYLKDTSDVLTGTKKLNMYYPYSSVFNKGDFYTEREFLYYRVMEEDFEKAFDRMTN